MREMILKPAQGQRRAKFTSNLGDDALVLRRFSGREGMSELFEFEVEVGSVDRHVDFDRILGSQCSTRIDGQDGNPRHFNGILAEAHSVGQEELLYLHRLVLRPWFWLLTKTGDCKIYKDVKVTDVIAAVLGKHSFASYEDRTSASYPVMEYCVQYCESDYNFLCRLMEEYGIYFFFDHSDGDHKLTLIDSLSAHGPKKGGPKLVYTGERDEKHFIDKEVVTDWASSRQFCTGKFVHTDYNYKTPSTSLRSDDSGSEHYQNSALGIFDYPGRHDDKGAGNLKIKVKLEQEQALDKRCRSTGDAVSCAPGEKIELEGHPAIPDGSEFLIVKAFHTYQAAPHQSSSDRQPDERYSGSYEFLPAEVQFRAPLEAHRPRIMGPQTAIVVGDGEIDVDKMGRIRVMFPWADGLEGGGDSSRWVRIAHGWSGKRWGDIKIPRVGMEVVVEFIGGDPDYPLVTGTVYNAEAMPPYDLPADKTISGVKSKTDQGDGYNEFIFDDRNGAELVRMHAERDLDVNIENDERRKVGNNVKIEAGNSVEIKVGNSRDEKIGTSWEVDAGLGITFVCGASRIEMTPASISLTSVNVSVQAAGMFTVTSSVTSMASAGPTNIQGTPVKAG